MHDWRYRIDHLSYGQALTDYERARFRLMIALGMTPEEIIRAIATGEGEKGR